MYFKIFPTLLYTFDFVQNSLVAATNIFSRFKLKDSVFQNALGFYKYQVEDGETAEIISMKIYGDPQFHWVICMSNNIMDAQFDLPISLVALEKNIIKKYGYTAIEEAMTDVHHYELFVNNLYTQADGFTNEFQEKHEVSLEQYSYSTNTVTTIVLNNPVTEEIQFRANNADLSSAIIQTLTRTSTYREVNVYDYEVAQNEKNRSIKILKREYLPLLMSEWELAHYG